MGSVRTVIRGWTSVSNDDEQGPSPEVLRTLDGLADDDERFTDYLGGPDEEALSEVLECGGFLRFGYEEGQGELPATTEYRALGP